MAEVFRLDHGVDAKLHRRAQRAAVAPGDRQHRRLLRHEVRIDAFDVERLAAIEAERVDAGRRRNPPASPARSSTHHGQAVRQPRASRPVPSPPAPRTCPAAAPGRSRTAPRPRAARSAASLRAIRHAPGSRAARRSCAAATRARCGSCVAAGAPSGNRLRQVPAVNRGDPARQHCRTGGRGR